MQYFNEFPEIDYNITGQNKTKKVTDIWRRVKVRSKIQTTHYLTSMM